MQLMPSLLSVFVLILTLFLSSFVAKLLKAKRCRFYWLAVSWLLTFVTIVAANLYQLDGLYALGAGTLVFMLSLLLLNGMIFPAAITTLVATLSIFGLLFVGELYLLQQTGSKTSGVISTALRFVPDSQFYDVSVFEEAGEKEADLFAESDEELVSYSEADLLPERVIKMPVIHSQVYHKVNPRKAVNMRGASFRLLKTDGKLVKGNIVGVRGNHLIIGKYVPGKGVIKAPIAFASIRTLEVLK